MSVNRKMDKEDVVYKHNGILLSYKKKNELIPFVATWMDLEIITLSEPSQTKRQIPSLLCGIQKGKKKTQRTYFQNGNRQTQKTNLWLLKGKGGMRLVIN